MPIHFKAQAIPKLQRILTRLLTLASFALTILYGVINILTNDLLGIALWKENTFNMAILHHILDSGIQSFAVLINKYKVRGHFWHTPLRSSKGSVAWLLMLIKTIASWNKNLIIWVKELQIPIFSITWNINLESTLSYALVKSSLRRSASWRNSFAHWLTHV